MKTIAFTLILGLSCFSLSAQTSFIIKDIAGPNTEVICDAEIVDGKYYFLVLSHKPFGIEDRPGSLLVTDENGNLIQTHDLAQDGYQFDQILSIQNDQVTLAGSRQQDSCSAALVISRFDLAGSSFDHLAELPICDGSQILRIRTVDGLDDNTLFQGFTTTTQHQNNSFIAEWNSAGELVMLNNDVSTNMSLSVDFSQKGYVLMSSWLCDFYDRQFNHRKQRYNQDNRYDDDNHPGGLTRQPFGQKYILEQVLRVDQSPDAQALRLADSNLYYRDEVVIYPPAEVQRPASFPLYGGVELLNGNTIWTTATLGYYYNSPSSFFSVTRLNEELDIVCTHFFGFDILYNIYGIKAIDGNGAVVYGSKAPYDSHQYAPEVDLFAYKVTDDCEFLTTSNEDPAFTYAISAFPNPADNLLSFTVEGFDPSVLRVDFTDASGRIVFSANDLSREIQVTALPAGQYFYHIYSADRLLGAGGWVKR